MSIVRHAPFALVATALLSAAALGACAHPIPTREGMSTPTPSDSVVDVTLPVVVHVENHFLGDVIVSVTYAGGTSRLGTVTAASTASFVVPASWIVPASALRLSARAIAGGSTTASSYTTPSITVRPGNRIDLSLESRLQRSSVAVY